MSAALSQLVDELAALVIAKVGDKLIERAAEKMRADAPDPLMTVSQVAARLGFSPPTIRQLVEAGALKKARGIKEIRIRQSVVDAYGK